MSEQPKPKMTDHTPITDKIRRTVYLTPEDDRVVLHVALQKKWSIMQTASEMLLESAMFASGRAQLKVKDDEKARAAND